MKINIWSDIRCPFCYIGKRKLELALDKWTFKDEVVIEWHSFELDPEMQSQPGENVYDYLAKRKGMSGTWSKQMHDQLTVTALEVGLVYNFDKAVISNSFDAHRLIQLSKKFKLDDVCEEKLFHAYFTEGKDISNKETLKMIGIEIGLDAKVVTEVLQSAAYSDEVFEDEKQARLIGVTGVPFFVFNEKYAISGAQSPEIFLAAFEQCRNETHNEKTVLESDTLL